MSKKAARSKQLERAAKANGEAREAVRRALKQAVRREQEIQRLTRQFDRALQKSNDGVQSLAGRLAARARMLEAEHETELALDR